MYVTGSRGLLSVKNYVLWAYGLSIVNLVLQSDLRHTFVETKIQDPGS